MCARLCAAVLAAALLGAPVRSRAQSVPHFVQRAMQVFAPAPSAPVIPAAQLGARIEDVSVQTAGVVSESVVRRYLSMRTGSVLTQAGVNRDYDNLVQLGGLRPQLEIDSDALSDGVRLHWIVRADSLQPALHPLYAQEPLWPIPGVGAAVRSAPVDDRGTTYSGYVVSNGLAALARAFLNTPLHVSPDDGRESDFVAGISGALGVYRESEPVEANVQSWTAGAQALYLVRATNGEQYEFGAGTLHSTSAQATGIVAPSLYSTYKAPARNTLLEAGYSRACGGAGTQQLFPPYCSLQYRFEFVDGIGGLGATNEYQIYVADVAGYVAVGPSTLALHAAEARTGGVLPDSFLVCGAARAYPKPFCGTDAQTLTAEYRVDDRLLPKLEFVVFSETAASRVRGGEQPWALPSYQWHAGSGIGLVYRGAVRLDLAYGSEGARLWFGFKGATF
ncbi:MAG: hypothetical protein JO104_01645 [Candidatus Eremiobacteraeota bacterium]|nr:hypothetical protein [Candidatus Eremiobacteraeota bacterium]